MKGLQHTNPCFAIISCRPRFMIFVVLSACMLFAFVLSACGGNQPSGGSAVPNAQASTTSTGGNQPSGGSAVPNTQAPTTSNTAGYPVKVFFSRFPESVSTNFSAVYPVDRVSPTAAMGTFALQLLIAGPTLSEQQAGYFTELNTLFSGPSNCSAPRPVGGPDFTLSLDKKGPLTQTGTATMQFCRSTSSPGIGADARVKAEITATLKQFPGIKNVVILTSSGHCFGDLSGKDLCLT